MIIYLDVKPEIALQRKELRCRQCEKGSVTIEYLRDLQKGYDDWLKEIGGRIPVLRIDYNDFIDTKKIVEMIKKFATEKGIGKSVFKF